MSGENNGRLTLATEATEGASRPRRLIEREYRATLGEAVTLDDWREIVRAAVVSAKQGDGKARDWLSRHLLGEKPITLTDLAADEADGIGAERDIDDALRKRQESRTFDDLLNFRPGGGGRLP